jgi:hypothetical protein
MTSEPDIALMTRIRTEWGATIAQACAASSVPPALLAALVANETGGDPHAKRFERGVLASLWEVLQGRKEAYGSLGRVELLAFIVNASASAGPVSGAGFPSQLASALQRLDGLATSWGLTQIMGYEAIVFGVSFADLQNPLFGLRTSLRMLSQFAEHNDLDVTRNFSELLDCWNTGRPHSVRVDHQYLADGLARMKIYQELEPPKAMSA